MGNYSDGFSVLSKALFPVNPVQVMSSSVFDRMLDDWCKEFRSVESLNQEIFSLQHSVPYDVLVLTDKEGKQVGIEFQYALSNYNKEDISVKVKVKESKLVLNVGRNDRAEENSSGENVVKMTILKGIKKSKWQASYNLGGHIDYKGIKAKLKNGTLFLTIPFKTNDEEEIVVDVVSE